MQQSKFLRAIEAFIKFQAAKGGTARSLAISVKDEAECQFSQMRAMMTGKVYLT
ncbi:uncharacterized protein PHALS_01350 [Plasmopara halstedii]|uniref:Uncharacterized protein n=1 Tax=Plasmopara halstedii TaxID=4781 RepID=A0A0N7L6R7_PLAHL|nr:uncharacterized protein PHALS_01350 [Plasmopara halstedii]CEG45027.1 hypothetical protein PHALS_01350 [Plasmopara halstedii]|eukprot:XP_024581396.1 hypothetical protein PHALS_01350 [Plasmopara halstedii]